MYRATTVWNFPLLCFSYNIFFCITIGVYSKWAKNHKIRIRLSKHCAETLSCCVSGSDTDFPLTNRELPWSIHPQFCQDNSMKRWDVLTFDTLLSVFTPTAALRPSSHSSLLYPSCSPPKKPVIIWVLFNFAERYNH